MRTLSMLAMALFAAGCSDPTPDFSGWSVAEIQSPAGAGSGEPFVSVSDGTVLMSWLEASQGGGHDLRFARWDGSAWDTPRTIVSRDDFFVNWADFPSVRATPDGTLWSHWLQRGGQGTYDYDVRIARSQDGGATWSDGWVLHETETPTEHGFVSAVPGSDGIDFMWLDGRETAGGGHGGSEAAGAMTVRYRRIGLDGVPEPDELVDGRVCDCCQTAMAATTDGLVAVYRNRTEDEIRDIYVTTRRDGSWSEGRPVHDDGWNIAGCPVNGPAVAATGDQVAVAWFTAPDDDPHVRLAFSHDGGDTFGPPIAIDDGNPAGRVDVLAVESGVVFVTWLERLGDGQAEIRIRRVSADGASSQSQTLVNSSSARGSGFPRIVRAGDRSAVMAWTDVTAEPARVRVTRVEWDR